MHTDLYTDFGRFISISVKMVLIVLHVVIVLYNFKFWVSPSQTAMASSSRISGLKFIWPQSSAFYYVWTLEAMLQSKPKRVSEFKDAV